ncbi:twin-arginine translocase TatA/TatE family subunit [Flavobacterium sp.]|uniref:twin-arginine translocase TatA/TatE family subunit n=1 Tax=Flavobacterium sp. TaxID=239 RepID=UPI003F694FBC
MNALTIFLGALGPGSYVLIGLAILLLFGGKKIPELMKGLGSGIKEFKNAAKEEENKDSKKDDTTTKE